MAEAQARVLSLELGNPPSAAHRRKVHPVLRLPVATFGSSCALAALQILGGVPGELAAIAGLLLAGGLAFGADWRYFPALLVLCYPMLGIPVGQVEGGSAAEGTFGLSFPYAVSFVVLAGVQVSAPLAAMGGAFGRLCLEAVSGRRELGRILPPLLLPAFLLAFAPALLGALQGQALGLNRWSQGMRAMLALSGFFWGALLVARSRASTARLSAQLLGAVGVGAVLVSIGAMRGLYIFLVVGFAAGALPYFLRRRRFLEAVACTACTVLATALITLTTAAAAAFALLCVALAAPRAAAVRRWLVRSAVFGAFAASLLLIWIVRTLSETTAIELVTRDESLFQYAVFKLMGDRGPLWLASIQQIMDGPYLVVPSGRSLRPQGFDYGGLVYTWDFGAHNALLELVRNVGLLSGGIGVLLMVLALWYAARLLVETQTLALRAVAAGFLGVTVAGVTTGNFPVYDVGFFLWVMGGWVAAVRWREQAERAAERAPSPGAP